MLRSQLHHIGKLLTNVSGLTNIGRSSTVKVNDSLRSGLQESVPCSCSISPQTRKVHLSHSLKAKKKKKVDGKAIDDATAKRAEKLVKELRGAAEDAAKSMPGGNWEKTSTDLLSRLLSHQGQGADSKEGSKKSKKGSPKKMTEDDNMDNVDEPKVDDNMDHVDEPKEKMVQQRPSSSNLLSSMKTAEKQDDRINRGSFQSTATPYTIFGGERLNIFDVEKINEKKLQEGTPAAVSYPIYEERKAELIKIALGGLSRNAFEDQIEMTKQGKLWNFPVDNEQDMHDERKFAFHEHVFLERHLAGRFPATGPVRRFMELVCVGLSKNPFLTVPEKMAHIQWYSDYFIEKQDILARELGEEGAMPEQRVLGEKGAMPEQIV